MKFAKVSLRGDPNIGLYGFATNSYCLLGLKPENIEVKKILKAELVTTTIAQTELAGLFASGNSSGIVLPKIATKEEIENLKMLGLNVLVLSTKETALGNLILCNDKGCLISDALRRFKKEIADCLNCEVEPARIAGLSIVGSLAIASNKGCLCHFNTSEEEAKLIEEILKVKVDVGSVGGSPFVKSGIIVNSNGVLVGENVSGPELDRIFEVFG
jgi:translation initiation factor 6